MAAPISMVDTSFIPLERISLVLNPFSKTFSTDFSITFDIKFPEIKLNKAYELLGLINENLWIGHFDITSKNGIPAFRHTLLSNNSTETLHKKFEDLVDIGIYECEKFYPSFQQVLFDDIPPKEAIKFSNFEVIGRA